VTWRPPVDLEARRRAEASDSDAYWAEVAAELPWTQSWNTVYEDAPPSFRWFSGGRTNLCVTCVDRPVERGHGGRTALAYRSERGHAEDLSFDELQLRVRQAAAALRSLGIRRGDAITIYMPTCIEAVVLMLAATRIGAVHSVVFAGFGAGALADRIDASGSRWLFTADVTYRRGSEVDLLSIARDAVGSLAEPPQGVVVLWRGEPGAVPVGERTLTWPQFLSGGASASDQAEAMEAGEPAFILATSGTTAAPKLVVHNHGGYQVAVHHAARVCFDLGPDDVWWATSDIGWIVGHSFMVYGPLMEGARSVVFEGQIDHPHPDSLWRLVAEEGVTGLFTSPTAIRLLMRYGEQEAHRHDLSALRRVASAGEVLNPAAYDWLGQAVLRGRVPVIDNMWQTETSAPLFATPVADGYEPRPGSAGLPLPGTDAAVVGPDGEELLPGTQGVMVLRRPTPGLTTRLWRDEGRYETDYWQRLPGRWYYVGDSARIDEDGFVWFSGRADEIIKIAAHRLGTIEVESALLSHPAVAEAGVVGMPDELRGEVIAAFVVLKHGHENSAGLEDALRAAVRERLGPVAVIGQVRLVDALPKTRSGKIMRRVLKAVVLDVPPGDVTTIEDEVTVEEARAAWASLGGVAG
jgi:acetyl-CoA synthetase